MALSTPSNLKSFKFTLSGLDEYLKKIEAAGNNVEEAVVEAIDQSSEPIFADMQLWAEEHAFTWATWKGIAETKVQREGNCYYKDLGIDNDQSPGAWHAVYVEYGTPTNAADPGIRRAFEDNKKKVKKIQREVLKKAGVPVD